MQPERKYRSILPGPQANDRRSHPDDNGDSTSVGEASVNQEGSKRKRRAIAKACNTCREKKVGCDGLQPCNHCQRRGIACEYATISKTILNSIPSGLKLLDETAANSHKQAAELLSILRSLADDQVKDVLQQFRAGRDASNIVAVLRRQHQSAYDAPFHGRLQGVPPPNHNSLEFELMVRHAIAYSPWAPMELPQLDCEVLSGPKQSFSVESPSATVSPVSIDTPSPTPPTDPNLSRLANKQPRESTNSNLSIGVSRRLSGRGAASTDFPGLCDERLHQIDASAWTNVPIPDDDLRKALSLYLETDHVILGLFDADLVLHDLISGGTRFCSRLLFNSLLAWACQAYTHFNLEAAEWSRAFYEEAVQQWNEEQALELGNSSTVAGLLYLSMSSMCHAMDTLDAARHIESAVELARGIGLFDVNHDRMAGNWPDEATDPAWLKANSQTAWGSFVFVTIQCAHEQTCRISFPPRVPIPGDNSHERVSNLSCEQRHSAFVGPTFLALCKLALISHDMIRMNYAGKVPVVTEYVMVGSMESIYKRYLDWADALPLNLVRSSESPHHVLLLHVYLHAFILDSFRPLTRHGDAMRIKLKSFTSQQASAEAACSASAVQLKRITATSLQSCASTSYSFLWNTALLYVANWALREPAQAIENPERRSDIRMCILGYQKLQRCFRLPHAIVRGLLSMVLREGLMTSAEARALVLEADERGKHHRVSDPVASPFTLDLDLCLYDRAAASVGRLAADFDEIAILNEFTIATSGREGQETSSEALASEVIV